MPAVLSAVIKPKHHGRNLFSFPSTPSMPVAVPACPTQLHRPVQPSQPGHEDMLGTYGLLALSWCAMTTQRCRQVTATVLGTAASPPPHRTAGSFCLLKAQPPRLTGVLPPLQGTFPKSREREWKDPAASVLRSCSGRDAHGVTRVKSGVLDVTRCARLARLQTLRAPWRHSGLRSTNTTLQVSDWEGRAAPHRPSGAARQPQAARPAFLDDLQRPREGGRGQRAGP